MEMKERVRKVINWLIFNEVVDNQLNLALELGYSKSYISQVLSGTKVASDAFIDKLCLLDQHISREWVLGGEGHMFVSSPFSEEMTASAADPAESIVIAPSVWSVIQKQSESLAARDEQVSELISMLRSEISEMKKMNVRQDEAAECADVG